MQLTGEFTKLRNTRHSAAMPQSLLQSPRLRRYARRFALAAVIALFLRAFFLTPYRAVGASVAPEIPAGSHVLAWRVAPKFAPGDIAVYQNGDHTFLGRVTAVSDTGLTVARANQPEQSVARRAVIGRVVLTTR